MLQSGKYTLPRCRFLRKMPTQAQSKVTNIAWMLRAMLDKNVFELIVNALRGNRTPGGSMATTQVTTTPLMRYQASTLLV
jgi:hypothetical protein